MRIIRPVTAVLAAALAGCLVAWVIWLMAGAAADVEEEPRPIVRRDGPRGRTIAIPAWAAPGAGWSGGAVAGGPWWGTLPSVSGPAIPWPVGSDPGPAETGPPGRSGGVAPSDAPAESGESPP